METTNLKLNVTNLKSIFPSGNGSKSIMGKSGGRFIPKPSGRGGTFIPPEGIKRRKRRIDAKSLGQVTAEIDLKEEKKKLKGILKTIELLKKRIAANELNIVKLKMGGSNLAPALLATSWAQVDGYLREEVGEAEDVKI